MRIPFTNVHVRKDHNNPHWFYASVGTKRFMHGGWIYLNPFKHKETLRWLVRFGLHKGQL